MAPFSGVFGHETPPKQHSRNAEFDCRLFVRDCFSCVVSSFRTDGGQHNLRSAAYEALMEMVKNSPKDCYVTVQKTTMVILERLQKVIQMEVSFRNDAQFQPKHLILAQ